MMLSSKITHSLELALATSCLEVFGVFDAWLVQFIVGTELWLMIIVLGDSVDVGMRRLTSCENIGHQARDNCLLCETSNIHLVLVGMCLMLLQVDERL
ncbi:hypothetical protein Tco_0299962 [Tanacetum coccineum]